MALSLRIRVLLTVQGRSVIASAMLLAMVAGCAPAARTAFRSEILASHAKNLPLLIYAIGTPGQIALRSDHIASAVYIQFVVTTAKPIDRVVFTFMGFGARGNPVLSVHGQKEALVLIGTGPFQPEHNYEINTFHSKLGGFPGSQVSCVHLEKVDVDFSDGQATAFRGHNLGRLMLPPLRQRCTDQGPIVNWMIN